MPVPARVQNDLRANFQKGFSPTVTGAKLAARFDCDPLGRVSELVYEYGGGHGQDLALVRFRLKDGRVDALRISRPSFYVRNASAFEVERGDFDSGAWIAGLPTIRGALLAKLEEKAPPNANSGSGFFSSNNWHGLVKLSDEAGRVFERGFTGYSSSVEQLRSLPLSAAVAVLDPIVDKVAWRPAPVDEDVRSFFVERFLSAGPERAAWWVKERLVILSPHTGTPALVPKLVELAQDTKNDASVERTREAAVDALAVLAGFDARNDARGKRLPVEEVAAAYARACKR